jgi:myo-inositol-1(or 4)-monophosphatase
LKSQIPSLQTLKETAVQAARASGEVLRKHFGNPLKISEKTGAGLVTNADLEAQNACVQILKKAFPDFGFLTEEAAPEITSSPGRWIIDPLDGTTNFIHGFPMFCVSIAAEWDHELVVGVIYHPILDELYVATKGQGATVNGRPLRVSETEEIPNSLLTTGFTYRKDEFLHSEIETFEKISGVARAIRRPGSAALDLAYTARGVFDGFWERGLSPWDVAAGVLLIREAGGKVTDFRGNPFRIDQHEVLASNSKLHSHLLYEIG